MADIPPASAPATSSHSSICAEPFLPTAPSFPALGSTFPTLPAFSLAATQASVPNKLLVSTHRPGIKISLECALTGRKRKQRGGGDRMGENAGCGFMVVCELVDQKGNPVGKAGKGTAEFKVTQNTPHNHQAPVATNNGVGRRECMQLVKGEADGAVGAVASRRKQWDRTERDREVLADSVEYKLFARELGLTAEEVKEMVCWQIPVPRATTRSRARPSSTTAQPSDHKSGVGPSLGSSTFPTCVAVAQPITQHTEIVGPRSPFPSYLDTLAEVALSDEAGPAIAHRRSISPFGLGKDVPSPPPSVIRYGQDDLVSLSTTFRRECFTTQATFNNADLPSPPRSAPAQSPRSSESDLAAQLPAPSLAPVATRPTLAIHPTALESDSPSPTATHHSSTTSGKRKLVLQVKTSALRQRGLSTKRPKQEHCDEDVKPFATAHASAAGKMDERELVKRLMSKFIGSSIESAIEKYSPNDLPLKLSALAASDFAIPPISLAWLPLLARRPPLHLLPPLPLHLAFAASARGDDHWAPIEEEMRAVEYLYRREGDITVEQVAALRAREAGVWRWVEVVQAMGEINREWDRVRCKGEW